MSAIFGILRFDGFEASTGDLERMANTLAHRGPHGRKFLADGGVGLGHCLLRVNQEDVFEAQPLCDREAGLALVADARIDNREELADIFGIAPAALQDMPDSALILRAYKTWGEACAEHLLGDFAFAVWDGRAKKLVLARDHMGQRNALYHHGKDFLVFATEARALWAVPGVPRILSEPMIGMHLLGSIERPPGATLYEEIVGLPGGTVRVVGEDGAVSTRTYWEPRASPDHTGRDEAYYVEHYRRIVTEAVACRLRRLTTVPALCFSGGFDSGIIAAVAGPIVTAQGRRLITISSVRAEGGTGLRRDARPAVEAFRAALPHLDVRYYQRHDETIFSDLESAFLSAETGLGNDYVRRGLFAIASAAGARLIMDGHGGDYTVNSRGFALLGRLLRTSQLRRFAREFPARMRYTRRSAWQTLRGDVFPAFTPARLVDAVSWAQRGFQSPWSTRPIARDFALKLFTEGKASPTRVRGARSRKRWRANALRILHLQLNAASVPPASLAASYGLAFSRPFHDKRIVEFALSIPEDLYFKHGRERHLARRAFGDRLPRDLLDRRPGNTTDNPDFFRMATSAAPSALDEVRRLDRDGSLSRYVDFEKIERSLALVGNDDNPSLYLTLLMAVRAIAVARFLAWFDRQNS